MNMRTAGLLATEIKFFDIPRSEFDIPVTDNASGLEIQPSSLSVDSLVATAQGDGPTQRDGHKAKILSLLLKGYVRIATDQAITTSGAQPPCIMLSLVLDTQCNGAATASEDVYSNLLATTNGNLCMQRNMSNTSRLRVLKEKYIKFPQAQVAALTGNVRDGVIIPFTMSLKFPKGLLTTYTIGSTTADVANIVDNNITLMAAQTAPNIQAKIAYVSRIRFVG